MQDDMENMTLQETRWYLPISVYYLFLFHLCLHIYLKKIDSVEIHIPLYMLKYEE